MKSARIALRAFTLLWCMVSPIMVSPIMSEEKPGGEGKPFPTWDQPANIRDAAERIARLQRSKGAEGAIRFIDACYRTHGLASHYSASFEACIVQDYLETKFLTRVYAGLTPEALSNLRAPSPELLGQAMGQRIVTAFNQYKVPVARAEDLKAQIDLHGAPVFLKIVFPNAEKEIEKESLARNSKSVEKEKKSKP